MNLDDILLAAQNGKKLTKEETIQLLNIQNYSPDFYKLLALANQMSRMEYGNRGYVFAQIGINAEPCSANCKFCSMGKHHYSLESTWEKNIQEIIAELEQLLIHKIDDFFLMTTADYPIEKYLTIASQVKRYLPQGVRFVANIGDFDQKNARDLKEAGFTGAYHIKRLGEGIDTGIKPEVRIKTLDAIVEAGLDLYYCVEPIGPEHTYEEIAEEILRGRDLNVKVMAVMRRTPVPGTPLADKGQIPAIELTKIAAVTRIVSQPGRAMNAHEVSPMTLLAGVNQLYAESGANPRDTVTDTVKNRGYSPEEAWNLLWEARYQPSP